MNTLTGDELLDLYIEAWTKLDAEIIIPHLASDFQYTSFWVLETLDRQGYTDYIRRKFESIKQSDSQILLKNTLHRVILTAQFFLKRVFSGLPKETGMSKFHQRKK